MQKFIDFILKAYVLRNQSNTSILEYHSLFCIDYCNCFNIMSCICSQHDDVYVKLA